jgi:hypothetical protein
MAGDTDFLALFQELGLSAGCRLDELKLAFRRRVSQLHPDRIGDRVPDAESRLQRLTATYNAALDFHRQYGRLPGYSARAQPPSKTQHQDPPSNARAPASAVHRKPMHVFIVVATAALLIWWLLDGARDDERVGEASPLSIPAESARIAEVLPAASRAPHRLMLGMSRQDALAIQGEPLSTSDEHWDYGPSWIAFKCGRVSDWYSSPLGPLRTSAAHPTPTDLMPVLRAVDCAPTGP